MFTTLINVAWRFATKKVKFGAAIVNSERPCLVGKNSFITVTWNVVGSILN